MKIRYLLFLTFVLPLLACPPTTDDDDSAPVDDDDAVDDDDSGTPDDDDVAPDDDDVAPDDDDVAPDDDDVAPDDDDVADDDDSGDDDDATPQPLWPLDICTTIPPSDPFSHTGTALSGDVLTADVGYSGGCQDHGFQLCWDGMFLESDPVQAGLTLIHDSNGDDCEAYITESRMFDLNPLKQAWQSAYGATSGTIMVHLGTDTLTYSF